MTNSEIVSRIIYRSIWLLDMRDDMDTELLIRIHSMFPGRINTNETSYRKMTGKDSCKKVLLLYFKKTEVFYGEDVPNRLFSSSSYDGHILLDYKAISALDTFISMDDSIESINYLLVNIDFNTARDGSSKESMILQFRNKLGEIETE